MGLGEKEERDSHHHFPKHITISTSGKNREGGKESPHVGRKGKLYMAPRQKEKKKEVSSTVLL